jgi:pimeloyl-ACP methyl ester carboxylesterase
MSNHQLAVPGASLYYEARGSGPALLLIPGGNGDAGGFTLLASELARRFTVISYDRRGFSRSAIDAPPDERRLATDGDDVIRLIDQFTKEPAFLFGSSSGAIVGLDVITRYPDRVRKLVAHEPPLLAILPDAPKHLTFIDHVYDTYRRAGVEEAMSIFSAGIGMRNPVGSMPQGQLPPEVTELMQRIHRNFVFWFDHEVRQYPRVQPDYERLQSVADRIVLAGGRESRDQFPYQPNLVLAKRLGLEVVDFPGNHVGYIPHAAAFAEQLGALLSS